MSNCYGLVTSTDPRLGSSAVNVTSPTLFTIPVNVQVPETHSCSPPLYPVKVPVRSTGPVTVAVQVRPWLVASDESDPGTVVVVVVVGGSEVVVVVVVGGEPGDTTNPRSDVVRSETFANANNCDADVPWSFGPAIPDWNV